MELALISEGTSDKVLIEPLRWLCNDIYSGQVYEFEPIVFSGLPRKPSLSEKIQIVLNQNRHQMVLIHRDQDNSRRSNRLREIEEAEKIARANVSAPGESVCVAVIPVRMTETWLLIDEAALKKAAGFPANKSALDLPKPNRLEGIANPKEKLYELIKDASGLSGRRLKKVRPAQTMHSLAATIKDYSPLDHLSAFQVLRTDIEKAFSELKVYQS